MIPVRAPLSLNSTATPVFATRSTPSVSTIVEINTDLFLSSASTTNCFTFVGCSRYSFSLADPSDFHCAWPCFKNTLHFICAEMVDVTGPVLAGVPAVGDVGGLGSSGDPTTIDGARN